MVHGAWHACTPCLEVVPLPHLGCPAPGDVVFKYVPKTVKHRSCVSGVLVIPLSELTVLYREAECN
jgi:hypothetical protein